MTQSYIPYRADDVFLQEHFRQAGAPPSEPPSPPLGALHGWPGGAAGGDVLMGYKEGLISPGTCDWNHSGHTYRERYS